mgnify:CR=1 FL=1
MPQGNNNKHRAQKIDIENRLQIIAPLYRRGWTGLRFLSMSVYRPFIILCFLFHSVFAREVSRVVAALDAEYPRYAEIACSHEVGVPSGDERRNDYDEERPPHVAHSGILKALVLEDAYDSEIHSLGESRDGVADERHAVRPFRVDHDPDADKEREENVQRVSAEGY